MHYKVINKEISEKGDIREMFNILLIEDDFQIIKAIESRLREKYPQCDIEKAYNFYRAETALSRYQTDIKPCHLIISDLHMSGVGLRACGVRPNGAVLNGWVFLRDYLLRENSQYHNISKQAKIIIFSAFLKELKTYTSQNNEDECLLSGISQIEKGRIYSGQGGYNKLMEEIENILS